VPWRFCVKKIEEIYDFLPVFGKKMAHKSKKFLTKIDTTDSIKSAISKGWSRISGQACVNPVHYI